MRDHQKHVSIHPHIRMVLRFIDYQLASNLNEMNMHRTHESTRKARHGDFYIPISIILQWNSKWQQNYQQQRKRRTIYKTTFPHMAACLLTVAT